MDYLHGLQKDMQSKNSSAGGGDAAWSSSLLRAASSLFDKLNATAASNSGLDGIPPQYNRQPTRPQPAPVRGGMQSKLSLLTRHASFSGASAYTYLCAACV
jgi:hypothetical protein